MRHSLRVASFSTWTANIIHLTLVIPFAYQYVIHFQSSSLSLYISICYLQCLPFHPPYVTLPKGPLCLATTSKSSLRKIWMLPKIFLRPKMMVAKLQFRFWISSRIIVRQSPWTWTCYTMQHALGATCARSIWRTWPGWCSWKGIAMDFGRWIVVQLGPAQWQICSVQSVRWD